MEKGENYMFIETPKSERKRVSLIGRTNTGKSSIINAITNQVVSIVSPIAGTTTDHTEKAMEILPAGPILFTDTPGIDDYTELGIERIKRTKEILKKSDFVLFVFQPPYNNFSLKPEEEKYLKMVEELSIPYAFLFNKKDIETPSERIFKKVGDQLYYEIDEKKIPSFICSAKTNEGIENLKTYIGKSLAEEQDQKILDGLVSPGDTLMLVIPINKAYPKGRLKPLQVSIMREALEKHIKLIVVQPEELEVTLKDLNKPPKIIVADSQVLNKICHLIPKGSSFTTFSILFANYKGALKISLSGLNKVDSLLDGDTIAIIEACTHHSLQGDMTREILPELLLKKTGKKLKFKFFSGLIPKWDDFKDVKLVLHCGGCMITKRDMQSRINKFISMNIPVINYGIFISSFYGINEKSLEPFRSIS